MGDISYSSVLASESRFVAKGIIEIMAGVKRIICLGQGRKGGMSKGLILSRLHQGLDGFVLDKDES